MVKQDGSEKKIWLMSLVFLVFLRMSSLKCFVNYHVVTYYDSHLKCKKSWGCEVGSVTILQFVFWIFEEMQLLNFYLKKEIREVQLVLISLSVYKKVSTMKTGGSLK